MEMRKSDVLDRWTILLMKAQHSEESRKELEQYSREAGNIMGAHDFGEIIEPLVRLAIANARTWENEAAIRGGEEMPDAEVGRRAKIIRAHNKDRVKARQEIDKHFGEIPDVKVDHASQ